MAISNEKIEDVLHRFATETKHDEESLCDGIQLSNDQKFEFRTAFRVVAGENKNSLPLEKIYELFLTLGLTFQDADIEKFVVVSRLC
jgi:hypothetical protein